MQHNTIWFRNAINIFFGNCYVLSFVTVAGSGTRSNGAAFNKTGGPNDFAFELSRGVAAGHRTVGAPGSAGSRSPACQSAITPSPADRAGTGAQRDASGGHSARGRAC